MVAAEVFSLNSTTATAPPWSGLASTSRPPDEDPSVPCLPSGSWSTAMTFLFSRVDMVVALAVCRLVPAMSGAAISAQRLNSDWSWVVVIPLPTSSMSGSFQAPGPAYWASCTLAWKLASMLEKLALMSPVVRHMLAVWAPHVQTLFWPHSATLNRIGRPDAARAARVAWSLCSMFPLLLQLSYLR